MSKSTIKTPPKSTPIPAHAILLEAARAARDVFGSVDGKLLQVQNVPAMRAAELLAKAIKRVERSQS